MLPLVWLVFAAELIFFVISFLKLINEIIKSAFHREMCELAYFDQYECDDVKYDC